MTIPRGENKTRADLYREADMRPPYPETWSGEYLLNTLFEVGPVIDQKPITYAELAAYSQLTESAFEPWEARIVAEMSRVFLQESVDSKEPLSIEPLERKY